MRHPNLSNAINDAIEASEQADEINLSVITSGTIITFRTQNTLVAQ